MERERFIWVLVVAGDKNPPSTVCTDGVGGSLASDRGDRISSASEDPREEATVRGEWMAVSSSIRDDNVEERREADLELELEREPRHLLPSWMRSSLNMVALDDIPDLMDMAGASENVLATAGSATAAFERIDFGHGHVDWLIMLALESKLMLVTSVNADVDRDRLNLPGVGVCGEGFGVVAGQLDVPSMGIAIE